MRNEVGRQNTEEARSNLVGGCGNVFWAQVNGAMAVVQLVLVLVCALLYYHLILMGVLV
jgi:hypothetical protein